MKTPFGHRLQTELTNEFRRMDSEWFFPWHGLNSGRDVTVDRFDGQLIRVGGQRFEAGASIEVVFWEAVARYTQNKINDVFVLTESEIRNAKGNHVIDLVEDASAALRVFLRRILDHAIDTDRRLKGRGFPDRKYVAPNSSKVTFISEIESRKGALLFFYQEKQKVASPQIGWSMERYYERNKGKLAVVTFSVMALGAIVSILRFLGLF